MRFTMHESDLPAFKAHLRRTYPAAKSSHRMEAAARGLGYTTYGGLLTDLKSGPVDVAANDEVFYRQLGVAQPMGANHRLDRALSRSLLRIPLHRVLDAREDLTLRGFDKIWIGPSYEMKLPVDERKALLAERRREAYQDDWATDQFELALIFLSRQQRTATINRKVTTYGLKHRAEGLSRRFGLFEHLGNYVADGMLIAAAYHLGFIVKPTGYEVYSARLNISMRSVNASRGWSGGSRDERQELVAAMYAPEAIAA